MSGEPNAASVAILRGEEILLIQRALDPWKGAWSLPGGRREPGESAEACARRELSEELGLTLGRLTPLTTLVAGRDGRFLLQVYLTTDPVGTPRPNDEIAAWAWVTPPLDPGLLTTPGLADVVSKAMAMDRAAPAASAENHLPVSGQRP